MKKIVFHADLDNTIIYSYKRDIGTDKRCVEFLNGREVSYITQRTYQLLNEVKQKVLFVPTTTRTVEQYHRIDLGTGILPYALVCNGGVLLTGNKEDDVWYQGSLQLIRFSREELLKAVVILEHVESRCFEVRFIKELFVFTKCKNAENVVLYLRGILDMTLVDVYCQGIKLYVIPKALRKGNAVKRFRKFYDAEYVFAAGDSVLDCSMLEAADYGMAPAELAERHVFPGQVKSIPSGSPLAETVLDTVLSVSNLACGQDDGHPY